LFLDFIIIRVTKILITRIYLFLYFFFLTNQKTYKGGGLKSTQHGVAYQLKLHMLFAKRGKDLGYKFRLATEMDLAEKFDDLVFIYEKPGSAETYRFLQAKHIQDETARKISYDDLMTTDCHKPFSLVKYFRSYTKILNHAEFKSGKLQDFIICTNIALELEGLVLKKMSPTKGREIARLTFEELNVNDAILNVGKASRLFKFDSKEVKQKLKQHFEDNSDSVLLANILAQHLVGEKTDLSITLTDGLIAQYQYALTRHVIDVETNSLKKMFLNDDARLSTEAKEFRNVLQEAVKQALQHKQQRKYKDKNFKDLSDREKLILEFFETNDQPPNKKAKGQPKIDFWVELGEIKLKLPDKMKTEAFYEDTPLLPDVPKFADEIAKRVNTKKKEGKLNIGIKKEDFLNSYRLLAGHVLVETDEGKVTFSNKFIDNDNLPGLNFINIFCARFSYETSFQQLFSSYFKYVEKLQNDVRTKNSYV